MTRATGPAPNLGLRVLSGCSLVCLVLAASAADAQIPVDGFTVKQALLRAAKTAPVGSVAQGAEIIGGTRTVRLAVLAGDGWAEAEAGDGRFTFRADDGTSGQALLTWTPVVGTSERPVGQEFNLRANAGTALQLEVIEATAGAELVVEVASDATHLSTYRLILPAVTTVKSFLAPIASFASRQGLAADFSNLRSLRLRVRGQGTRVVLGPLAGAKPGSAGPLSPVGVTASKTAQLFVDLGSDGFVNPGDTLKYTVTINTNGTSATGASFADTLDAQTALVSGSVNVSPVAVDDTYSTLKNTALTVSAGSGVLANDRDFLGDTSDTVTTFDPTSAGGGTVSVAADGSFTYTPVVGYTGSDTFHYTVSDSGSLSDTATVSVNVFCPTITVTNPATTMGTAGTAFSATFTQTGANGAVTWSETGALPTGITLNSSTGVLSGTTTQTGSFPITVTATDSKTCSGTSATYTLVINCQTITVTNPATDSGPAGTPFSATFTATGTLGTLTWSETGSLPTGITLNSSSGVLSGTPTQAGSFPITAKATDTNGCFGTSAYTLTVTCPTITVTNPATTTGTAGTAFSQTFTQSGGAGTITWSKTGALPTGITFNTSTGVLSGTTSQTGSFPITVTATDQNGCTGTSAIYTLVINCQTITVTNPATTSGTEGVAFSQTFTAAGILGTPTWSETGALPTGMSFNTATGVLSGTPTQNGSFPITVTVTDTNGCSGTSATYTLVIACPTITVTRTGGGSFPAAVFNTAYTGQSATATGSNGTPYTFTISAGALPTGTNMSAAGAISGTPSATGTYGFTVEATDSFSCTGTTAFTIPVKPSVPAQQSYSGFGNTQLYVTGASGTPLTTPSVSAASTLLTGVLPATSTVSAASCTVGAALSSVDSTGHFVFTPNINTASSTCSYTVSSDTGSTGTPATVTTPIVFTLSKMVWYVNGASVTNGDGRSHNPFNTLVSASAAHGTGHYVFVESGGSPTSTPGAITLQPSALLYGQGVSFPLAIGNTSATSYPTLTGTVTLANSVTVNGLDLSTGASTAISGSGTGVSVTPRNVSGSGSGINVSNLTGTLTTSGGTITGGNAVVINGGTANYTIGTAINDAGQAVNVQNTTGGTIAFNGAITNSGTGIFLNNNTGATMNVTGGITLDGASATFTATAGGTVNVTGTNTIGGATPPTATALIIKNTTIGSSNVTFEKISAGSSSGSAGNGIILDTTGSSGSLQITGTGSAGSGGTIQHKTGSDGDTANGIGIYLNSTSNPSFAWMQLNDFQNYGIRGTSVTGFSLSNTIIDGTNGTSSSGGSEEGAVRFDGLFTSVAFPNATIQNSTLGGTGASDLSFSDNLRVINSNGTLNRLTITSTNFGKIGINGNNGLTFSALNNGTVMKLTVKDSSFTNAIGSLATVTFSNDSTMDLVFRNNALSNNNVNQAAGGGGLAFQGGSGNSTVTYDISCNTFKDAIGIALLVAKGNGSGTMVGTIFNNTVGLSGTSLSGSTQASGIKVKATGSGTHTTLIRGNVVHQTNEEGIFIQNNDGSATLNASVFGNTVDTPGSFSFAGLNVDLGALGTDTSVINVVVGSSGTAADKNDFSTGDPFDFSDVNLSRIAGAGTQLNLSKNGSASGTAAQIIDDDNLNPATTNTGVSGTVNLVTTLPTTPPPLGHGCP